MDSGSSSKQKEKTEEETNPKLVAWECWGLAAEEYLHTIMLYNKNKNGKPMGHR